MSNLDGWRVGTLDGWRALQDLEYLYESRGILWRTDIYSWGLSDPLERWGILWKADGPLEGWEILWRTEGSSEGLRISLDDWAVLWMTEQSSEWLKKWRLFLRAKGSFWGLKDPLEEWRVLWRTGEFFGGLRGHLEGRGLLLNNDGSSWGLRNMSP